MAAKAAIRAIGALSLSAFGSGAYLYNTDEGAQRMIQMYGAFAPVVLHYRLLEAKQDRLGIKPASKEEADAEWEDLHERWSPHVLESMRKLQGFYIKVGQVLAGRTDTLPPQYTDKLRTLEDACPPRPLEEIRGIVESSLGVSMDAVFSEFDEKPLGVASIGQVHKARLREGGQVVAVKVQDPKAERLFRSDIRTARGFCTLLAPEQLIIFDEIERQFLTEFDYRLEAEQVATVNRNMRPFSRQVAVPRAYPQYCSKDVLVMDYLPGRKLYDVVQEEGTKYAARQGKTFAQLQKEMHEKIKREGLPPPYKGPGAFQIEMYRRFLASRDFVLNVPLRAVNAVAWVLRLPPLPLWRTDIPPNSARIMDVLMKVMGHQILVDGFFNADPHAGNFLLMPDGRVGLIDFGQIKRLTEYERYQLAKILRCLMRGDKQELKALALSHGYQSKYLDADVIWNMTRFGLDQDGPEVTGGLNVQQFMDQQFRKDPWSKTDDLVIMPVRVSFMLRGVGLSLGHPVSSLHYWGPLALQVISDYERRHPDHQGQSAGPKTQTQKS